MPVTIVPIPDFPGYYVKRDGTIWSTKNSQLRQMLPGMGTNGYHHICLRRYGDSIQLAVHRLILTVFVGPCPPGHVAAHNNGIKTDNRIENLRWDTVGGNYRDKKKHGTLPLGDMSPRHKLTSAKVLRIRQLHAAGYTQKHLAKVFGVHNSQICLIVNRKNWGHI